MTITTQAVPSHAWLARRAAKALWDTPTYPLSTQPQPATSSAVLTITGLPPQLRPLIERALVVCLRSEPEPARPGVDPLEVDFFTRWRRDRTGSGAYGVRCRQVVTGTDAEIAALTRVISELAAENGFTGRVEIVAPSPGSSQ